METVKYIIKRLLLAVLILLGVSVIIYGLSRMMPTDFIDQKYSSQLSNGSMTQADVDRIKEIYGLNMPDAFLTMEMGKGSKYAGQKLSANTKVDTYESDVKYGAKTYFGWYTGYVAKSDGNTVSAAYDSGDIRLKLYSNGTYEIGRVTDRKLIAADEIDEDATIEFDVVFSPEESGTFELVGDMVQDVDENGDPKFDENGNPVMVKNDLTKIRQIVLTRDDGYGETTEIELKVGYRKATGIEKSNAIFKGYFTWLGNMLQGDLGMSFKYNRPVSDVIKQNMGISFAIAFIATILQFVIAIPLGIKAATNQYGVIDYTVTVLTMMGISLPTFFLAAIVIRVFAVGLGWFEVGGITSATMPVDASWIMRLGDILWHMVLPMFVLVVLSIGSLMRYTRTNTLEALNADYVRTARAKGLSEKTVIYKHAFRNTLIPLVTMLAGILPSLFGGAMITETVFSIPGIGKTAYDALVVADVPFIMGYNMFIAILTVVGTLISDLMYAVVDPRVKIGR